MVTDFAPQTSLLSDLEFAEFVELEGIIKDGLHVYYRVGAALLKIREKRLYRYEYSTFEAYCIGRWGMKRNYANKLIAASEVITYLGTNVPIPNNEAQARPLTTLEPEDVANVWKVVKETAPEGIVTSGHVKSIVNVFKEALDTSAIDGGDGESIPIKGALHAAISDETTERLARQTQHLAGDKQKPVIAEATYTPRGLEFTDAAPVLKSGVKYRVLFYEVTT